MEVVVASEDFRKMIETFTLERLVEFMQEARAKHLDVLKAIIGTLQDGRPNGTCLQHRMIWK